MNDPDLDSDFAGAVRAELVAIGTKKSSLQRHQRHTRLAVAGIVAVALAAATTGAAILVSTFPGSTTVTPIGQVATVTRTGTAVVELGPAPTGANSVIIDVTCISHSGTLSVPATNGFSQDASGRAEYVQGWAGWDCAKRTTTVHIRNGYLAAGGTSIKVTADPGTTWKAVAQYGSSSTSDWGVNAHGQTFGAPNGKHGFPDLQGAEATNGKVGYIYVKEFNTFEGNGCINVYESDGTTMIGRFGIGVVSCNSSTVPGK